MFTFEWDVVWRRQIVNVHPTARSVGSYFPSKNGGLGARYDIDAVHIDDYFYPYREQRTVVKRINGQTANPSCMLSTT